MAELPMMPVDQFWELIDRSRSTVDRSSAPNGDAFQDQQAEHLADLLRQLPPEEIVAFDLRFMEFRRLAYRWELWGAAYWAHGGCGDDSFTDFRSNLISLGRERYLQVLNNPDALAELINAPDVPYLAGEGFQYIAGRVYEEKTGRDLPIDAYPRHTGEPAGKRWDFDDEEEAARRFPRLYERFPEMGD